MRFFQTLVFGLLPLTALSAKDESPNIFSDYHKKLQRSTPLDLTNSTYAKLTEPPRDYAVAVLFTAMATRYGCQLCKVIQPEWELLAKSWARGDKKGESRLIMGTLDFADGMEVFKLLGLQTAPVLFYYPPISGPDAVPDTTPQRYDFINGPQTAEEVRSWLVKKHPGKLHPPIYRPLNWAKIIGTTTAGLGTVTFFYVASPYLLPVIQNRNLWAALSLIAILLFTSGHMFNHIRQVPYVVGDGRGGVSYFAGGFQNQYGLETQIIAAMYGLLSFATISLALKVPRMANPGTQQVAVLLWTAVIFLMYSFLLSIFRMKNGGYPFWLPPFS